MQGYGGDSQPNTGVFRNNVLQLLKNSVGNPVAHPAWGIMLGHSCQGVSVDGNIVSRAQCGRAVNDSNPGMWMRSILDDAYYAITKKTQFNTVTDNIFDCGASAQGFSIQDGAADPIYQWSAPGFVGNRVVRNVFVRNTSGALVLDEGAYGGGNAICDTLVPTTGSEANLSYATIAAAQAARGYLYVDRTLKTYLVALGVSISSDDGVPEYVGLARNMRKGQWRRDLMAKPIVNYIRFGFLLPALR
jgi:hypothetical protein